MAMPADFDNSPALRKVLLLPFVSRVLLKREVIPSVNRTTVFWIVLHGTCLHIDTRMLCQTSPGLMSKRETGLQRFDRLHSYEDFVAWHPVHAG